MMKIKAISIDDLLKMDLSNYKMKEDHFCHHHAPNFKCNKKKDEDENMYDGKLRQRNA